MLNACAGEEAGVKSVEMVVRGRFAYGYLAGEKGTHRLVRQSPFNAKAARQTSFAAVEVMPVLGEVHEFPPSSLWCEASLPQVALSCCHGVMRLRACLASDAAISALRLTAHTPAYLPALCMVNSWHCAAGTCLMRAPCMRQDCGYKYSRHSLGDNHHETHRRWRPDHKQGGDCSANKARPYRHSAAISAQRIAILKQNHDSRMFLQATRQQI